MRSFFLGILIILLREWYGICGGLFFGGEVCLNLGFGECAVTIGAGQLLPGRIKLQYSKVSDAMAHYICGFFVPQLEQKLPVFFVPHLGQNHASAPAVLSAACA